MASVNSTKFQKAKEATRAMVIAGAAAAFALGAGGAVQPAFAESNIPPQCRAAKFPVQCAKDYWKEVIRKSDESIKVNEAAIRAAKARGAAADARGAAADKLIDASTKYMACIANVEKAMETAGGTDYILGLPKDAPLRVNLRAQRDSCGPVPSKT